MVKALSFPLHLVTFTLNSANIPPFLNTQMTLYNSLCALSYSHSLPKSLNTMKAWVGSGCCRLYDCMPFAAKQKHRFQFKFWGKFYNHSLLKKSEETSHITWKLFSVTLCILSIGWLELSELSPKQQTCPDMLHWSSQTQQESRHDA